MVNGIKDKLETWKIIMGFVIIFSSGIAGYSYVKFQVDVNTETVKNIENDYVSKEYFDERIKLLEDKFMQEFEHMRERIEDIKK